MGIKFLCGGVFGFYGYMFADLTSSHVYMESVRFFFIVDNVFVFYNLFFYNQNQYLFENVSFREKPKVVEADIRTSSLKKENLECTDPDYQEKVG